MAIQIKGKVIEPLTAVAKDRLEALCEQVEKFCYPCNVEIYAHGPWLFRIKVSRDDVWSNVILSEHDLEEIGGQGLPFVGNIETIASSLLVDLKRAHNIKAVEEAKK